jgi:hypothetical protein
LRRHVVHAPQLRDLGAVLRDSRGRDAPDSRFAMPPTSRPPIAFGWPVSENGPAPGLPIWPVARCRLISAAFFAVPLVLWLRPWQ